jgi:DNA-directed RNA polymerase specialized sigma24 family protein
MSSDDSVTRWIRGLTAGDQEAARLLWERYFDKLVAVARKQLGWAPRRVADEEDVALSVFRCLCDGAARGQFSDLANRDDLWRLLVLMTARKVSDQKRLARQQKRGGGKVRGDSALAEHAGSGDLEGFDRLMSEDPTPEFLTIMADEYQRLMDVLGDDTLRQIALWKTEGYTNEEIADRLQLTRRSVERKLQWIRQVWSDQIDPP